LPNFVAQSIPKEELNFKINPLPVEQFKALVFVYEGKVPFALPTTKILPVLSILISLGSSPPEPPIRLQLRSDFLL